MGKSPHVHICIGLTFQFWLLKTFIYTTVSYDCIEMEQLVNDNDAWKVLSTHGFVETW